MKLHFLHVLSSLWLFASSSAFRSCRTTSIVSTSSSSTRATATAASSAFLLVVLLSIQKVSSITAATRETEAAYFNTRNTHIIQLTDDNFEHLTQASTGQTTGKWFVNFSSPKCPHCVKLYPIWKELAEQIKSDPESSVLIGLVDTSQNPELVKRFQIKSMPSLYFFANGGMYRYGSNRSRTVEDFVLFVMGEHQQQTKMQVPLNTGGVMRILETVMSHLREMDSIHFLVKDLENIFLYRKNAAALLFGLGFTLGVLLCTVVMRRSMKSTANGKHLDADKKIQSKID